MLEIGTPIFITVPDESEERVFHHGKVLESDAGTFVAEFDRLKSLPAGFNVQAYNEVNGKFYRQSAVVKTLSRSESNSVMTFERVGIPVSAERRGSYRVRMLKVSIMGRIGEEQRCPVTDVSPEGLSSRLKRWKSAAM
jgi:hypothetical protein